MKDFPKFMKNKNFIKNSSQYSKGIEGYVYDGVDGAQMAYWTCKTSGISLPHKHDYDEYMAVIAGSYSVTMKGMDHVLKRGDEIFIKKGILHGGKRTAGTRTIHVFGGPRAERAHKDVFKGYENKKAAAVDFDKVVMLLAAHRKDK